MAFSLLLALGVGVWVLDRTLETMLRTQVDAYLRARTLALVHSDEGKALRIEIPYLDLSLIRRRLVLRNVRIQFQKNGESRSQYFEAFAPGVTITGVDLTDAIWHRTFRLAGVAIAAPVLHHLDEGPPDTISSPGTGTDTIPFTLPAADSLLYSVVAGWLPDEVRGGRIGSLMVSNATISSTLIRGRAITVDSTADLSLTMRGLQLDSTRHRIFERATLTVGYLLHARPGREDTLVVRAGEVTVSPDDTAFSIGQVYTGPPAGGHSLRVLGVRRSHAKRILTIDSVSWAPPVPDSVFFRVAPARSTRVRLAAVNIRVLGMQQENLRRRRLTAGGVWIGDADLDVLADRRAPSPPKNRVLWPVRLASLDWVVGADSAVVESGKVRYAEWPASAPQPAHVKFDQLRVRVLHATNDTAITETEPLVIDGRGRLLGVAPFHTTITVQVRPGPLRMRAEGEVGSMPISRFNTFVLPANGLEITGGTVENVAFWFDVAGGKSVGELRAVWRDLDLRLVDPVTGKQSLGRKLKSVMARMLSKDDNQPGKRGKVPAAEIQYGILPTDTFWGVFWRSLRSGLVAALRG